MQNESIQHKAEAPKVFLDFQTIFAYRSLWMFLAILWIVVFHAPITALDSIPVLYRIRYFGYSGVDIFMFASGIGCAASITKDPDVLRFMKRRAEKAFPRYLVALVPWFIYRYFCSELNLTVVVGNIFGQSLFVDDKYLLNWYITGMWFCYLLTPLALAMAKAYTAVRQRLLIVVVLTVLSFTFFYQVQLLMWSRIPIFFLGVCAFEVSTRKRGLTRKDFGISMVLMAIGWAVLFLTEYFYDHALWNLGMYWYPFILITPGLCYLFSWLASLAAKTRLRSLVDLCLKGGKYTFSVFLSHIIVFPAYSYLCEEQIIPKNRWMFLVAFAVMILLTLFLEGCDTLYRRWKRNRADSRNSGNLQERTGAL